MQLTTIIPFLLSASLITAAPLSISKRTAATVLSDLSTISSDVKTLTTDAKAYTGSLIQSLALLVTVDDLESSLASATTDTTSSGAFSTADSASVTSAVTTLTPKIVTLLADLDNKLSVIKSAGYSSLVLGALNTIYTNTDALFVALEAAADATDAATLVTLKATVDTAFTTAVGTF